jgi:beta-glucosidase
MKKIGLWIVVAGLAACGESWMAGAQDAQKPAYLNPSLPAEQRAADLVSRMTLQEKASQLVNQARAIPRLKVPAYDWWSESLHGVAVNGTTEFPEPIGLAATFDAPAIHQMAIVIGVEGASSTRRIFVPATATSSRDWTSGHPTSISFAIPVGVAARRPTAKTRS